MANKTFSQIKIGSTTYDICDATMRTAAATNFLKPVWGHYDCTAENVATGTWTTIECSATDAYFSTEGSGHITCALYIINCHWGTATGSNQGRRVILMTNSSTGTNVTNPSVGQGMTTKHALDENVNDWQQLVNFVYSLKENYWIRLWQNSTKTLTATVYIGALGFANWTLDNSLISSVDTGGGEGWLID